MNKILSFILGLFLIANLSFGQDCKENFINAASDTNYLGAVSKSINNELSNCSIPNISWTEEINSPRIVTYIYTIKLTCKGNIVSTDIESSQFEYVNGKGETVKVKGNVEVLKTFEDCIKNKLLNIKNIQPLLKDKEPQNTEIIAGFNLII